MKTKELIQVCGSIIKQESLVAITSNIAKNTCVAFTGEPYSNYYGVTPFNMPAKSISMFLFTVQYYSLQEVLRFAKLIDLSYMQSINIAVSVLQFTKEHYPAIRIKNFPDHNMIYELQESFIEQGVEFANKVPIGKSAVIRTSKCFSLEEIGKDIFIDHLQDKTAYIALSKLIDQNYYSKVIADIRNNTVCPMFDSARGAIILDSEIKDIIRIYSDHLDIEMLKCIQDRFEKGI